MILLNTNSSIKRQAKMSEVWDTIWENRGYFAIVVSAIGFGSNFIPVKNCATGDGLFFQFIFCTAVLVLGAAIGFLCSLTKVDVSDNRELSGECTLVYL